MSHTFVIAYELGNIAILNAKCVDYRCILWNMTRMMQLIGEIILH